MTTTQTPQQAETPPMAWPGEEFPRTHGWPQLARVSVLTRAPHAPHAPVRQEAVAQVLDFYREGA